MIYLLVKSKKNEMINFQHIQEDPKNSNSTHQLNTSKETIRFFPPTIWEKNDLHNLAFPLEAKTLILWNDLSTRGHCSNNFTFSMERFFVAGKKHGWFGWQPGFSVRDMVKLDGDENVVVFFWFSLGVPNSSILDIFKMHSLIKWVDSQEVNLLLFSNNAVWHLH